MPYMVFGYVGARRTFVKLDLQPWPTLAMARCRLDALRGSGAVRLQIHYGDCEVVKAGRGNVVYDTVEERT